MTQLSSLSCNSQGEVSALSKKDAEQYLQQLDTDWEFNDTDQTISFDFKFKNYYETMAFVNAIAWVSHQQDHHPDLEVGYNHCLIRYSTHSVSGLSIKDFICAAHVEQLTCLSD